MKDRYALNENGVNFIVCMFLSWQRVIVTRISKHAIQFCLSALSIFFHSFPCFVVRVLCWWFPNSQHPQKSIQFLIRSYIAIFLHPLCYMCIDHLFLLFEREQYLHQSVQGLYWYDIVADRYLQWCNLTGLGWLLAQDQPELHIGQIQTQTWMEHEHTPPKL